MVLSVLDMFKVGAGPSSSHMMGLMMAAGRFLELMRASPFFLSGAAHSLHGSLAYSRGGGDAADHATLQGLPGHAKAWSLWPPVH